MNAETMVLRWQRAALRAGLLLEKWWRIHHIILTAIAPILPDIIEVLKSGDLDKIEDMLGREERG